MVVVLCGATLESPVARLSAGEELQQLLSTLSAPGGDAALREYGSMRNLASVVARVQADPSAPAKGLLAELHLLGLPDHATGKLKPPGGFPRSADQAAVLAAAGAATGGCGRCFFLLGALLEQGEPEVSRAAHFHVREGGRVEFRWAGHDAQAGGKSLDRPVLAYYVGAELGDPLAKLALAHYVAQGLTLGATEGRWWLGQSEAEDAGDPRQPQPAASAVEELARCRRTFKVLVPVAEEAALNEDHLLDAVSDVNFRVEGAAEVQRAKKEHADWVAAHAKDQRSGDQVAQAAYHLHGDADVGVQRNESRARQLFDKVASKGDLEAAWSALLLHARSGDLALLAKCAEQLIQSPDVPQVRKVVAQHYVFRHGFNVQANSTRAGVYLLLAANLGDGNAQQTAAHAYAGLECPELEGVDVPGVPNQARALQYYQMAARQGRPVSAVNAAILLMGEPAPTAQEAQRQGAAPALQVCSTAVKALRDVALSYHPEVLRLHAHARRAFHWGDKDGALLRFQLLSELGARNAHANAAALWRQERQAAEQSQDPEVGDHPSGARALQGGLPCWRLTQSRRGRACEVEYLHREAALTGDVDAMVHLSSAYAEAGKEAAAFAWASKAAGAGNSQALYDVAHRKENGLGTTLDFVGACEDFCRLLHRSEDSAGARGLALFRVMKLRRLSGQKGCCPLPEPEGSVLIVGAIAALLTGAAAIFALCS